MGHPRIGRRDLMGVQFLVFQFLVVRKEAEDAAAACLALQRWERSNGAERDCIGPSVRGTAGHSEADLKQAGL